MAAKRRSTQGAICRWRRLPSVIALAAASVLFLHPSGLAWGKPGKPAPPNVVLILVDDVGTGDLGSYGGQKIKTPNLDGLASQGVRFTSMYATPACGPSRYSLMTGRYTQQFEWWGPIIRGHEQILAQAFKDAGYVTACIGKWHGLAKFPDTLPTRRGFDQFYGYLMGHNYDPDEWHNEAVVAKKVPRDSVTQRENAHALDFIREVEGRPFFLFLSYTAGHHPPFASKAFQGRSATGRYGDMLEEMDWSVGQVLNTLAQLGLEENTIVVFLSDNGGMGPDSSGALRGIKGSLFEGGVRVPALVRWPRRIEPGRVESAPAHMVDWFPTLAKLAGLSPSERRIDGRDLSGALFGTGSRGDENIYWGLLGHRSGEWKLILDEDDANAPAMLFNLDTDPGESSDLAAEHPEIAARLRRQLSEFWRERSK